MKIRLPFYVLGVEYGCILSSGILNYTWHQALNAFPKISKSWWSMEKTKASTASDGKTSSAGTWPVSTELVRLCVWAGGCPGATWLQVLFLGREKESQRPWTIALEAETFKQEDGALPLAILADLDEWNEVPLKWWEFNLFFREGL